MALTRLKQLREEAVLTVHELAEASGVSDDTISKIENGQRVARPNTLRKLARALDVSPQELRRPVKTEELAAAGKAEAPREAGPGDEETPSSLTRAEVLKRIAELWDALLSRGLYDLDTLEQMYIANMLLAWDHDASIQEYRETLAPNLLRQLEAAEEQFMSIDGQILEMLEKTKLGHTAPPDELAAKREARRQELRGGKHARHA